MAEKELISISTYPHLQQPGRYMTFSPELCVYIVITLVFLINNSSDFGIRSMTCWRTMPFGDGRDGGMGMWVSDGWVGVGVGVGWGID